MAKYTILLKETLGVMLNVEANSKQEAIDKVWKEYEDGNIAIDEEHNHVKTDVTDDIDDDFKNYYKNSYQEVYEFEDVVGNGFDGYDEW